MSVRTSQRAPSSYRLRAQLPTRSTSPEPYFACPRRVQRQNCSKDGANAEVPVSTRTPGKALSARLPPGYPLALEMGGRTQPSAPSPSWDWQGTGDLRVDDRSRTSRNGFAGFWNGF